MTGFNVALRMRRDFSVVPRIKHRPNLLQLAAADVSIGNTCLLPHVRTLNGNPVK